MAILIPVILREKGFILADITPKGIFPMRIFFAERTNG